MENEAEVKRGPGRPPTKKPETVRSAAAIRSGKVRRRARGGQDEDPSFIPAHLIPQGFSVEWKTKTVTGMPIDTLRPLYTMNLQENGWEPASPEDFKELLPDGYTGNTVERGGQILMIRPMELTQEALAEEKELANSQVSNKMRQINETGSGEFKRTPAKVSRTYERVEIPSD